MTIEYLNEDYFIDIKKRQLIHTVNTDNYIDFRDIPEKGLSMIISNLKEEELSWIDHEGMKFEQEWRKKRQKLALPPLMFNMLYPNEETKPKTNNNGQD